MSPRFRTSALYDGLTSARNCALDISHRVPTRVSHTAEGGSDLRKNRKLSLVNQPNRTNDRALGRCIRLLPIGESIAVRVTQNGDIPVII